MISNIQYRFKIILIFSGNHSCFSINRVFWKKTYHGHFFAKIIVFKIYMKTIKKVYLLVFKKKKITKSYYNLINLDTIFFNSKKKQKISFYIYFRRFKKKKVNLEVLYPFYNMEFTHKKNLIKNPKIFIL